MVNRVIHTVTILAADELVKALKEENTRLKDASTASIAPRLSMPISEAQSAVDARFELEIIRGLTGLHLTAGEQEHTWTAAMEGKRGGRTAVVLNLL